MVWNAFFLPFGAVDVILGSTSNNLRFLGQYFLLESGLHYNWHRHYDPTLGRYTQADPKRDVQMTRPINLDGSTLTTNEGISEVSQLATNAVSTGPSDFWKWYHRKYKKPGDPDLETPEEAKEPYEEWCKAGKPGPDNKGSRGFRFAPPPIPLVPRPRMPGGGGGLIPGIPVPFSESAQMICVMRVGGSNLGNSESVKLISAAPYRRESSSTGDALDVFYYEVADTDDKSESVSIIRSFIAQNERALSSLAAAPDVRWINLDIGLMFPENALSSGLELDAELVSLLGRNGFSVSISIYKTNADGRKSG